MWRSRHPIEAKCHVLQGGVALLRKEMEAILVLLPRHPDGHLLGGAFPVLGSSPIPALDLGHEAIQRRAARRGDAPQRSAEAHQCWANPFGDPCGLVGQVDPTSPGEGASHVRVRWPEGETQPDVDYLELGTLQDMAAHLVKAKAKDVPTRPSVEPYSLANLPMNVSNWCRLLLFQFLLCFYY